MSSLRAPSSAACCSRPRSRRCATRSIPRRRAAPTCSACGRSALSRTGGSPGEGSRGRSRSPRGGRRGRDRRARMRPCRPPARCARPPAAADEDATTSSARVRAGGYGVPSMTSRADLRRDPGPPGRRAGGRPGRRSAERRASGRTSKPIRSTCTRSSRSSRTPTASRSPTRRRPGSSPSVRRSTSCSRAACRAAPVGDREPRPPSDDAGRAGRRRPSQAPRAARRAARGAEPRACSRTSRGRAKRSDSYERLAFLGDSVLVAGGHLASLPAPRGRPLRRRPADEDPRAGRLGSLAAAPSPSAWRSRSACAAAAPPSAAFSAPRTDRDRASARIRDRGGDRCLLSRVRLRADRRGGRRGVRARARGGARASDRLQVRAAGAPRAPGRRRQLLGAVRDGPAARPHVHDRRARSAATRSDAAAGRSKKDAEQEAARAALQAMDA